MDLMDRIMNVPAQCMSIARQSWSVLMVRYVDGEVTEQADETYTMDVASRKTGVLSATLHNLSDELKPGPNNSVEFTVTTDSGLSRGVTDTAVVRVTGPGE